MKNPEIKSSKKKNLLYSRFYILDSRSGFTLIEMLVAIALFAIAVSVAIGGFARALRTQREVIQLIAANSNASLALEQMAWEVRTGSNFQSCQSPCTELKFTNADGESVDYNWDQQQETITRAVGGNPAEPITATNVEIHYLYFLLGSGQPARVTVNIGVGGRSPELQGNVTNIETSISSRAF